MPKIIPNNVQTCFEQVSRPFFSKKLFAQCSMDSNTRCLPKVKLYLNSMTRTPKPKHMFLHYRKITSLETLVGSVRCLITLLKNSLFYNIVERYATFLHCWHMPNPNRLLRYTKHYYIAEIYPILLHCRTRANFKTLLSDFPKTCRQPIRFEYVVTR